MYVLCSLEIILFLALPVFSAQLLFKLPDSKGEVKRLTEMALKTILRSSAFHMVLIFLSRLAIAGHEEEESVSVVLWKSS